MNTTKRKVDYIFDKYFVDPEGVKHYAILGGDPFVSDHIKLAKRIVEENPKLKAEYYSFFERDPYASYLRQDQFYNDFLVLHGYVLVDKIDFRGNLLIFCSKTIQGEAKSFKDEYDCDYKHDLMEELEENLPDITGKEKREKAKQILKKRILNFALLGENALETLNNEQYFVTPTGEKIIATLAVLYSGKDYYEVLAEKIIEEDSKLKAAYDLTKKIYGDICSYNRFCIDFLLTYGYILVNDFPTDKRVQYVKEVAPTNILARYDPWSTLDNIFYDSWQITYELKSIVREERLRMLEELKKKVLDERIKMAELEESEGR